MQTAVYLTHDEPVLPEDLPQSCAKRLNIVVLKRSELP
jgi:hypothetical protein